MVAIVSQRDFNYVPIICLDVHLFPEFRVNLLKFGLGYFPPKYIKKLLGKVKGSTK